MLGKRQVWPRIISALETSGAFRMIAPGSTSSQQGSTKLGTGPAGVKCDEECDETNANSRDFYLVVLDAEL